MTAQMIVCAEIYGVTEFAVDDVDRFSGWFNVIAENGIMIVDKVDRRSLVRLAFPNIPDLNVHTYV